ncbi:MAG: hypothetical protein OEZ68_20530 [Gammaproteobacteria bacterium]|nr:hypothetical protein [Gammaproteobacteria bacterium]
MNYYGGDTGFCSRQIPSTYIHVGKSTEFVFQNDMAAPAYPCARGIRASLHIIHQKLLNYRFGN